MSTNSPTAPLQDAVEAIRSSLQNTGSPSFVDVARVLGSASTTVYLTPRTEIVANVSTAEVNCPKPTEFWIPGV